MKTTTNTFGYLHDGREAKLFRFESTGGLIVSITNYGGIIVSILAPDRNGMAEEITAGFEDLQNYLKPHPHFGVIVGRFANRIAEGKFSIDQIPYQLPINDRPNHLHGGNHGFHTKLWHFELEEKTDAALLTLSYTSPHMEEGYPGTLKAIVEYTLTDRNEIIIQYLAETDALTHVNLTSHGYFNLGGFKGTIFDHHLMVNAHHYLENNENQIPTGKYIPCKDTSFDYSAGEDFKKVKQAMDHCFVLAEDRQGDHPVAILNHEPSGRKLTIYGTQPGLQVYTGNFLDGSFKGHNESTYLKHYGICLEGQHFPDSPNQQQFPSTLLKPGDQYLQTFKMVFSVG